MSKIKIGSKVRMTTKGFYDGLDGVVKAFVPAGEDCHEYMDRCGAPKSWLYSATRTHKQDRWLIEIKAKTERKDYTIYICKTAFNFIVLD